LTLTGTEAQLNTFLSTVGNVKYTAPATFPTSGDVLTLSSLVNDAFKYTDIDTIAITAPAATGLALSVGSMMVRQGNNGSAIGIKGTSNLLSA